MAFFSPPVFWKPHAAAAGPSIAFVAKTDDLSNATVYTFTNHAIGTAAADRIVVVACHSDGGNSNLSSVTIGGSTATRIHNTDTAAPQCGLAYLVVAAGTTATIVVTWSIGVTRCSVGVWSITGTASSTPIDTDTPAVATSTTHTATIDLPTGSVGVAAVTLGDPFAISWNVGSEAYEATPESGMTVGAATLTGTGNSPETVTATHTSNNGQVVAGVWQ